MILLTERINEEFKKLFQKQITVTVRDRKLANGKLLLHRLDGFYLVLVFVNPEDHPPVPYQIEIPYPFNIITEGSKLVLDYRLEAMSEKDFQLLFNLQSISKKRESKFYNSTLEITQ